MVSRVKSLSGLMVLWDFSKQKISCRQSQDTRDEMKRLEVLRLKTVLEYGSTEEINEARVSLQLLRKKPGSDVPSYDSYILQWVET